MAVPHGSQTGVQADVSEALRKFALVQQAYSPRVLLQAIGQAELEWIGLNLRAAGTEHPWQQMAASTIAARPLRQSPRHFSSNYQRELQQGFVAPRVDEARGEVTVGTQLRYSAFHQYGTRPYEIRPKRARFLVFPVAGGGFARARVVHHPGLPARPFLPTSPTGKRVAVAILQAMAQRLAQQFGGTVT